MKFEWDQEKSRTNKEKHGIDFETAKLLWADEGRIEVEMTFPDEKRWAVIARIVEKVWTAICTLRDETVRLISVRRARPKEVRLYGEKKGGRIIG
jgi:uncharacterized protein